MRTNIDIDDQLHAEAQRASGARTKRETVQRALEALWIDYFNARPGAASPLPPWIRWRTTRNSLP